MPNRTIYVSAQDESLFEEAKTIAGEALSSVISRALREFVTKHQKKSQGMKEIALHVGNHGVESEKRFIGSLVSDWQGFSDDKIWWQSASIYRTQKGNWAVHLTTVAKATLLTDKKAWKANGDYLVNARHSELIIGATEKDFEKRLPHELYDVVKQLMAKDEKPIEYLDI